MKKPKKISRSPKVDPDETLVHSVAVTSTFVVDGLTIPELEDLQRMVVAALKRIDSSLNDCLRRKLVQRITNDLDDSEKCTPGLYQAALRLIGEELGGTGMEGTVPGSRVDEIIKSVPFKTRPLIEEPN